MVCLVQGRPKNAKQVKNKVKGKLIAFLEIDGIVLKEFVLTVQSVNSA
jgi:hypothetical protein